MGKDLGISSDGKTSIGMDGMTNRTQECALGMSPGRVINLGGIQVNFRDSGESWECSPGEGKDPGRAGARPGRACAFGEELIRKLQHSRL